MPLSLFRLPFALIRRLALEWRAWRTEQTQPRFYPCRITPRSDEPAPYPVDLAPLLALPFGELDADGVPRNRAYDSYPAAYHPTTIAQYGLACWNAYLVTGDTARCEGALTQARWLVAHALPLAGDALGWPIPFPSVAYSAPGPWLSALTQGNALSLLVRAWQITGGDTFRITAARAARTFARDILDGGITAPVGDNGIFFEEVAVYPAAHILNGGILALIGLMEYVAANWPHPPAPSPSADGEGERIQGDGGVDYGVSISRAHRTLHDLLPQYDAGYWSRYDLLHRRLVTPFYHQLHVTLLHALANMTGCPICAATAQRWTRYQRRWLNCIHAFVVTRLARLHHAWHRCPQPGGVRNFEPGGSAPGGPAVPITLPLGVSPIIPPSPVLVPITAFPVAGGMRGVLAGVAQAMAERWQLAYLTHRVGPDAMGYEITRFGRWGAAYWQFPNVWLYVRAGRRALRQRLRVGDCRLVLPQDGVFTSAFAVQAARGTGARVVVMDHGNLTLLASAAFRDERRRELAALAWPARLLGRMRLALYWPALRRLARITARGAEHFLVAGDEVADVLRNDLGVADHRITRYPYMMDVTSYGQLPRGKRAIQRQTWGMPADAILMAMINRLAPEKGLDVALMGIAAALADLPDAVRARVRIILAGDGPLRQALSDEIAALGLRDICHLPGEVQPQEVPALLGSSDIFLYTGTRGTNYSLAVLEAMAAGCAVIATTQPRSNATLLAEGRGMAIPPDDPDAVRAALVALLPNADARARMGAAARAYVTERHSAAALRRTVLRATGAYRAPGT